MEVKCALEKIHISLEEKWQNMKGTNGISQSKRINSETEKIINFLEL